MTQQACNVYKNCKAYASKNINLKNIIKLKHKRDACARWGMLIMALRPIILFQERYASMLPLLRRLQ